MKKKWFGKVWATFLKKKGGSPQKQNHTEDKENGGRMRDATEKWVWKMKAPSLGTRVLPSSRHQRLWRGPVRSRRDGRPRPVMGDFLAEEELCGQTLLRLVSRGSAIIAELLRLAGGGPACAHPARLEALQRSMGGLTPPIKVLGAHAGAVQPNNCTEQISFKCPPPHVQQPSPCRTTPFWVRTLYPTDQSLG